MVSNYGNFSNSQKFWGCEFFSTSALTPQGNFVLKKWTRIRNDVFLIDDILQPEFQKIIIIKNVDH